MSAVAIIEIVAKIISTAIAVGPTVIKTVEDAKPFAKLIYDQIINKKEVTQDELDELERQLKILSDQLQLPLDP